MRNRNRKFLAVGFCMAALLTMPACQETADGDGAAVPSGNENVAEESITDTGQSAEEMANQNTSGQGTAEQETSAQGTVEAETSEQDTSETAAAEQEAEEPEITLFVIAPPGNGYYLAKQETVQESAGEKAAASVAQPADPLTLTVRTKEANEIIDEKDWFTSNGLDWPVSEDLDGNFILQYDICQISLYQMSDGELFRELDLSAFLQPDEGDNTEYADRMIRFALMKDEVLYVEISHMTYASEAPGHAYILAIDPKEGKLLWKSQNLVCNSYNFLITGGVLLCGYGFTAEPDYLYQLDPATGEVIDSMPLVTMADYIIEKDGLIYVRTYNTNYVLE